MRTKFINIIDKKQRSQLRERAIKAMHSYSRTAIKLESLRYVPPNTGAVAKHGFWALSVGEDCQLRFMIRQSYYENSLTVERIVFIYSEGDTAVAFDVTFEQWCQDIFEKLKNLNLFIKPFNLK